MENMFGDNDGLDKYRNATFIVPELTSSLSSLLSMIRSNGKVKSFKIERRVPKKIIKTLNEKGDGYRVPLGFVFVDYEDSKACYHITCVNMPNVCTRAEKFKELSN